ncbi:hypothetical protein QQS21_005627 [Conoideocrella luteorostrata]|uniref:Uncharacterized protein n=1 Tax=Conoideocrella luteorostrata TaxID=1105319 RepID=A0AAJ0CRI6_9HYPO|nr:hypothetical protein QQS21_005627 [Conoideocrella luteorostrata]
MRFSKTLIPACAAIACSGATAAPNQQAVYSAVDPVYSILKKPLQAIATSLCSSYLGYPRSTSVTVTAAAATVTVTSNLPPPTVTLQATQNAESGDHVYLALPSLPSGMFVD